MSETDCDLPDVALHVISFSFRARSCDDLSILGAQDYVAYMQLDDGLASATMVSHSSFDSIIAPRLTYTLYLGSYDVLPQATLRARELMPYGFWGFDLHLHLPAAPWRI